MAHNIWIWKRDYNPLLRPKVSCIITLLILAVIPHTAVAAYIPFSPENAAPILQKIVEKKTLPVTIKKNGMVLTIKEVKQFTMNWEKSEFELVCSFDIAYSRFLHIKQYGEISISGSALLASKENSLGVRFLGINRLSVENLPQSVSITALAVMNSSFRGKEYWMTDTPAASVTLTKQNFSEMLRILLAQKLPVTLKTGASHITFYNLLYLTSYKPGKIFASFYVRGFKSGIIDFDYAGVASVDLELNIDMETLDGYVKIGQITRLDLENRTDIMQGIIRMIIRSKLEDKTIPFSLNKK